MVGRKWHRHTSESDDSVFDWIARLTFLRSEQQNPPTSKVQVLTVQETHRDDVIAMVDVKGNQSLVRPAV